MTQPAIAKLRLSSPADLVQAVPYLLGFHPADSLVAIALRGARRRVVFTMRLDLPSADEPPDLADPDALAGGVAAYLAHAGAERAVVVTYSTPPDGGLPHSDLIRALTDALAERAIELTDAIHVGGGRWWSHVCANPACCPAEGTPVPSAPCSTVAATATYAGLVALPSREALEASLEPAGFLAAVGMRQALERAEAEVTARIVDQPSLAELRAESVALLAAAVDGDQVLTDVEIARLIVGLDDTTVRDACCGWATMSRADRAQRLWTMLARRSTPPWNSVPLVLVGWFAYLSGDATLAAIAVDRCLRGDPGHRLALLLREALQRAVDPAALRAAQQAAHPRAAAGPQAATRRGPTSRRR